MKRIALLGGTSWPSTIEYYKELNERIQRELGGHHSCPMILYNIDYHEIKSHYASGWNEIPELLKTEIENIMKLLPDGLMICNNTLHKAFDIVKNEMEIGIPVFHIIELTKSYILENGWKRVLLLGTKFTMEDEYFKKPLIEAGIQIEIPILSERDEIQEIQSQLAKGVTSPDFELYFQNLSAKYADFDAFILGCTELPLVCQNIFTKPALINTITLQCQKAVEFIIS